MDCEDKHLDELIKRGSWTNGELDYIIYRLKMVLANIHDLGPTFKLFITHIELRLDEFIDLRRLRHQHTIRDPS